MTSNAELVRFWFEEVWYRDNNGILEEMFTEGTQATGPVSSLMGQQFIASDFVTTMKALLGGAPEFTFGVFEEAGPWVITCFDVHVTSHPHRPPFDFDGQMIFKVENGQITAIHSSLNYIKLFEGLGQMPPDTLPVCLSGAKLDWK
ncbi:nuclear transport factor 2 family protein [Leisingera daeponensis]|uniref:nuclear transport factor 2 family protein n=1 Tax=Leisingera daeponensis TaxID=405746 RepID=UPI001C94E139|nr:nuclear transport factor 2 family protein [Leisingera daeponensis]MBY6057878.1 nuclear transport factor 2 family protein [Leisingera daeponensis]